MRQYYWRSYNREEHFDPALPIHPDIAYPIDFAAASGNENRFTGKLHVQIANKLDRHNAGLKFNYCLRFDPRHFSLLSTCKVYHKHLSSLQLSMSQWC
jgi:hypothetical protein